MKTKAVLTLTLVLLAVRLAASAALAIPMAADPSRPGNAPLSLGASVTLEAVADASTSSAQANQNFGSDTTLAVGRGGVIAPVQSYTYVGFDLGSVPSDAVVSSAQLELWLLQWSAQGAPIVDVHAIVQSWNEAVITWDTQPLPDAHIDSQALALGTGYKSWDVTTLVQAWLDGSQSNHDLVLVPAPEQSFSLLFSSREEEANPPRLVIDYTTPTPTPTPGPCPDNYEPNDSFEQAPFLLPSTEYWAAICNPQDVDYYGITVAAGHHIRAELWDLPADFDLDLYGPNRNLIGRSNSSDTTAEVIEYDAMVSGSHYIKVYGKNGAFDPDDPYRFKVTLIGAALTPTSASTPTSTPTGTVTPTPTPTPEEPPDLLITDVWNQDGLICYQIINGGKGPAAADHRTRLRVDGAEQAADVVEVLLDPEQRLKRCFNYNWQCSGAQDVIETCADVLDSVHERDEGNNCRQETWKCDTTAPRFVGGPHVSGITDHSATVCWNTDEPSDSRVSFGARAGLFGRQAEDSQLVTQHCLGLNNLTAATTYHYAAASSDPSGNRATSRDLLFRTLAAPDDQSPLLLLRIPDTLSGTVTIAADAQDDTGVDRVVFDVDGVPVHTDFTFPFEWACDTRGLDDASHIFGGGAFDVAGNETTVSLERQVRNRFPVDLSPLHVSITQPPSRSELFGSVVVEAEVTHDLRTPIERLELWADGHLLVSRDYQCTYRFGIERCSGEPPLREAVVWDASAGSIGSSYIISATAVDRSGNRGSAGVLVTVEWPEPQILVRRSVARDGNRFAVTLDVQNTGLVDIHDVTISDLSFGFQCASQVNMGVGGVLVPYTGTVTYSVPGRSSTLVANYLPTVGPDSTLRFIYHAVPILFAADEDPLWPTIGDSLTVSYRSGDSTHDEHPRTRWACSGERRLAFAEADYLLVTNPRALYEHYAEDQVNELLATMAELASEKNGVLGFLPARIYSHVLKSWISPGGQWARQLSPAFDSPSTQDAYLLFVGETEIVPSYDYSDVALSDNYYADVTGGNSPELIIGRIIGDSAAALANPIRSSLHVHYGTGFDRRAALALSGYEGGSGDIFLAGAVAIGEDLERRGVHTDLLHWSTWIEHAWTVRATDDDAFALGDIDGDGIDEVLFARDEEQEVYLYKPSPPILVGHFPIRFHPHDGFATGDLDADGIDEIVTAEVAEGRLNVYEPDGTYVAWTMPPFTECDGLAIGDVLGTGWAGGEWFDDRDRDEIVLISDDHDRVYIYRLGDSRQLRRATEWSADANFTRYDGFGVGDVRPYNPGDDEGWRRDEIVIIRDDDQDIYLYDADGRRLARLDDLADEDSVDVRYTPYDGFAIGDVDDDGLDEMLVVCDEDDKLYGYGYDRREVGEGADRRWVDWKGNRMYTRYFDGWFHGVRLTGSPTRHDGVAIGRVMAGDNRKLAILRNRNGDNSSFQVLVPTWDDADEWANERVNRYADDISVIAVRGHGNPWGASPIGYPSDHLWGTFAQHPFVLSLSCLTGHYNDAGYLDRSFGEVAFAHGAAVFIGATEVSYSSKNGETARRYFNEWDLDSVTAGKGFRQYERARGWDYWVKEYNYYGDPKFGASGTEGAAARAAAVPLPPPSTLNVAIPMYMVESVQELDYVDIPGGEVLLEDYQPRVPFYVERLDLPAGYRVQDVQLTQRAGASTATDLHPPIVLPVTDTPKMKSPLQPAHALARHEEWHPVEEFAWTMLPHADGTSQLLLTIYPFYYNALTTDVRFYDDYQFHIDYTVSSVTITHLAVDKTVYAQGETAAVEIELHNAGALQDVVVDTALRAYGSDEWLDGLLLRTLTNLSGRASFSAQWDSRGFAPGEYYVHAVLRGASGELLDVATTPFRLGIVAGEVVGLTATPQHFAPGDDIAITLEVRNAGTVPLSGTAVIQINDASSTALELFHDPFVGLSPGSTRSFEHVWDTAGQRFGAYTLLAYVLYDGTCSAPQVTVVSSEPEHQLFLPIARRSSR